MLGGRGGHLADPEAVAGTPFAVTLRLRPETRKPALGRLRRKLLIYRRFVGRGDRI